jgi:hypothetical protein
MPAAPARPAINVSQLVSRVTRDQGPEFEQTLPFTPTGASGAAQVSTPTSLRTDRKVRFFDFHWRGRITNNATAPTYRTNTLLGTPLFSLVQQFTLRGQHLRYGSQTPIIMRGEFAAEWMAIMNPNYVPRFSNSVNGGAIIQGAALSNTASATNDVDWVLPIPMFPYDESPSDQTFYSLHGPDWPGNLYFDVIFADSTALGAASATPSVFSSFGSGAGSPSMDILSERPLVSKDIASKIRPGVVFRVQNFSQPTTAVSTGAASSGIKLGDLTVGKDTTRILFKAGTAQAGTTAGVVVYASLSDSIVTRIFFSMDNRQLRFQNANADSTMQDYMGRMYGRSIPVGYKMLDLISGIGTGTANPKASFQSSQLTAARKFEVDGDVSLVAGTQIAEFAQEMILGRPALLAA